MAPRRGRFDPRSSVYTPLGTTLRRTRAKLARVQAQEANARCKIAIGFDSESAGFGSSVGLTSPGTLLRKMFAARGYPVGTGWMPVFCNIGSGVTRDSRWSYVLGTGAWEYTGSAAGGGNMHFHLRAVTDDINAVFSDPEVTGTIAEVVTFGNGASFTRADDGTTSTVTPSGASAVEVSTVTGLPDSTHTIRVNTDSAAATYLAAAQVRPACCVEVSAFGLSGSRTSDHLPTLPFFYNPFQVVDAYDPDCVVYQLGVNDALAAVPIATYTANVEANITAYLADGRDVILVNSIRPNALSEAAWTPYREALYDLADANHLLLVDLTHRLGSYTLANGYGLMYDTTHPNGAGHADEMQAVLAAIIGDGVSGSRVAATGPVLYTADNFGRPDAASAGSTEVGSKAWAATGTGTLSIAANRLVLTTAGAAETDAYVDAGHSDGTVQLTLTSMAASSGLLFRSTSTTTGYVFWRNPGTGAIKVAKRTGVATYTDLSGSAITDLGRSGDVMKVVLNGTAVRCYLNGKLVYSFTDSDYTTNTRHGLWKANVAGAISMDSFSHTAAVSA